MITSSIRQRWFSASCVGFSCVVCTRMLHMHTRMKHVGFSWQRDTGHIRNHVNPYDVTKMHTFQRAILSTQPNERALSISARADGRKYWLGFSRSLARFGPQQCRESRDRRAPHEAQRPNCYPPPPPRHRSCSQSPVHVARGPHHPALAAIYRRAAVAGPPNRERVAPTMCRLCTSPFSPATVEPFSDTTRRTCWAQLFPDWGAIGAGCSE